MQNNNDTEGRFNFERCKQLNVPANMDVLMLPDREEVRSFQTVGPSGIHSLEINGYAAAMECYLQLDENACVVDELQSRTKGVSRSADQQGRVQERISHLAAGVHAASCCRGGMSGRRRAAAHGSHSTTPLFSAMT